MLARKRSKKKSRDKRETLASVMAKLYRGRDDARLVYGEKSKPICERGRGPDLDDVRHHLAGNRGTGIYLVDDDGKCCLAVIDLDDKEHRPDPKIIDKVRSICALLDKAGLDYTVCTSQSGRGYHVAVYFARPILAATVRRFLAGIIALAGAEGAEIYPKQNVVASGSVGSGIRLPLYNRSRFVDVGDDLRELDPQECLDGVVTVSIDDLEIAAERLGIRLKAASNSGPKLTGASYRDGLPPVVQHLLANRMSRLARRWSGDSAGLADGSTSAILMSIACCLIRKYVPTADIYAALKQWSTDNGYAQGQRHEWLERTIGRAYELVQTGTDLTATRHSAPVARIIKQKIKQSKWSGYHA